MFWLLFHSLCCCVHYKPTPVAVCRYFFILSIFVWACFSLFVSLFWLAFRMIEQRTACSPTVRILKTQLVLFLLTQQHTASELSVRLY